MWRTIIVALALICLGLLGYYAVTKRAAEISGRLAVNAQGAVKVAGVGVSVEQRDARLRGTVSSEALKADAERAVLAVSGIKSVKNELVVEAPAPPAPPIESPKGPDEPPTPPPTVAPPPTITSAAVAEDVGAPAPEVVEAPKLALDLTWDGALLSVSGTLPEGLKKDLAMTFVSEFPDANVKDQTTVTTTAGTPDLARAMKAGATALARLQSGKVVIDEEAFELSGVVATADDQKAVKDIVATEVKGLAATVTLTSAPTAEAGDQEVVGGGADGGAAAPPVPEVGELTPAQCQTAIDLALEGERRIVFKGPTGRLADEAEPRIQEVWALLQRCPAAKGQIVGYHDNLGEPDKVRQLTAIRAYNVYKRLVELGMDKDRFKYSGVGQRDFKYPNRGETRVLNQRVEFKIEVE